VARLLESAGHTVETGYPSVLDAGLPPSFFALATALIAWELADVAAKIGRPVTEVDVEPVIWHAAEAGRRVTAVRYQEAVAEMRSYVQRFAAWWSTGWDLLLTPTLAVPPYRLGATSAPTPEEPWPDVQPWIPFTPLFNLSGQPAISLPLSWNSDGLPIGVQLGASLGREDLLVAVAAQLERLDPWQERWPPHSYPETAVHP
jgi:amidase